MKRALGGPLEGRKVRINVHDSKRYVLAAFTFIEQQSPLAGLESPLQGPCTR